MPWRWGKLSLQVKKERRMDMRYAPVAVSTRDSLLGLVFEEYSVKYARKEMPSLSLVYTKVISKRETARLLEELEREYDNRI
jgi:hypothetical protein